MDFQKGITTIEIAVVLFILTLVTAWSLVISLDTYRNFSFKSERNLIVDALQKSRNRAINNICLGPGCTDGKPHGVRFESNLYIIFQGSNYSSADHSVDEAFPRDETIQVGGLTEVVFSQLSGDASPAGDITVTNPTGQSSTININNEGRITWTN